jgi:hypothetical protein
MQQHKYLLVKFYLKKNFTVLCNKTRCQTPSLPSLATFYAIVFCISSVAVGNFCKSMVTGIVMVVVMLYGHAESNYLYCFFHLWAVVTQ